MKIHREGFLIILIATLLLGGTTYAVQLAFPQYPLAFQIAGLICLGIYVIILQFFRSPVRYTEINDKHVIAPADGKVVVIEEVDETEYFKDRRIQVSIFMSPFNVHVNRNPISGLVKYYRYHAGKYLVAWHPKSSTENERTTVVIGRNDGTEVLFRQIAGALARRVICYVKEGDRVVQGKEMGFIKFGSRVDIFLPLGTKINVKLGDKPVGGETVIAEFE